VDSPDPAVDSPDPAVDSPDPAVDSPGPAALPYMYVIGFSMISDPQTIDSRPDFPWDAGSIREPPSHFGFHTQTCRQPVFRASI
jgi:hypothetical protein